MALFATDIATTFFGSPTPEAVASVSQLGTWNTLTESIITLLLSVLVIKFRHKSLFLVGSAFIIFSAIGSYFAPSLLFLQVFYIIEGVGSVIISIISMTIIADALPEKNKAQTIGYMYSMGAAATLVIMPIVGFLTNAGGWRAGLVSIVMPFALLGLITSLLLLPPKINRKTQFSSNPILESFRKITKTRSAIACLVANLFIVQGSEVAVFALAFYRIQFLATRDITVLIYEISLILFLLGPIFSGRIIDRFGAKKTAVSTTFLAACCTGAIFFVPNFWVATAFDMIHVWFAAMAIPAFALIVLDQVPSSRGTMFSLSSFFNNIGKDIAPLLGGTILALSSGLYGAVGLTLSSMTIIGCIIIIVAVKTPTQKE
ncbi:MAG: MFS transporter [Crenarchaeota archaeon]|nr:MFS transporter [Thermoproteota archaeon]